MNIIIAISSILGENNNFNFKFFILLTPSSVSDVVDASFAPFGDSLLWPLRDTEPRDCPSWLALEEVDAARDMFSIEAPSDVSPSSLGSWVLPRPALVGVTLDGPASSIGLAAASADCNEK